MAVLKYHDGTGWEPVVSALQGPTGPTGVAVGLPTGGATGASLIKSSSTDYATEWSSNVGGLVHINTSTGSGVSALSLNNVFTSTFRNYKIIVDNEHATNASLRMRLRVSGADNSTSNYSTAFRINKIDTPSVSDIQEGVTTSWAIVVSLNNGKNRSVIDIFNPQIAKKTQTSVLTTNEQATGFFNFVGGNHFNLTTAFDGFSIFPSSSTITLTVQVFGYKD